MEKQHILNDGRETFSNFTVEMLRSIVRDTVEADMQSERELLE